MVDLRETSLIPDLPEQISRFGVIGESLLPIVQTLVNQSKIGGKLRQTRQVLLLAKEPGGLETNVQGLA